MNVINTQTLILKDDILLIEKKKAEENALKYQSEYEQRSQQGTILKVPTGADPDFTAGREVFFSQMAAIEIEGTSMCLVKSGDIMAVDPDVKRDTE